eukprot:scaffold21378_cov23-Cyclotella_meneghiniana.AAC.2
MIVLTYVDDCIIVGNNMRNIDNFTATNTKNTPVGKPLLNKDLSGKPRKLKWKYRTAVGMLSYLQGNTRPEISMATHQTARFCTDPKLSHEQAIMQIGRYLLGTADRGIIYEPDPKKGQNAMLTRRLLEVDRRQIQMMQKQLCQERDM